MAEIRGSFSTGKVVGELRTASPRAENGGTRQTSTPNRRMRPDIAAIIGGSVAGAVLRYTLFSLWPSPSATLVSTVVSTLVLFGVLGYLLTSNSALLLRAFVAGCGGGCASVSGYTALAANFNGWLSVGFLVAIPVCVVAALCSGAALGLALRSGGRGRS